MYEYPANLTLQEQDLKDFLCTLGVRFPVYSPNLPDEYVISPLGTLAASVFKSRDGKAVLLGYRLDEITYPLSILFLSGDKEALLGHSTLLLDSYSTGTHVLPRLQEAIKLFFSQDADVTLGALEKSWVNVPLKGQVDCRILWQMKPTLPVAVDVFVQKMGNVPEIPLFPSVYSYNNPYLENTLEVGLFEIGFAKSALVLGAGAGLDAVCIALQHGIPVDATDVNPVAVANTMVAARRCGVENLVHAWVSDGFDGIDKKYDAIFFSAPLATQEAEPSDVNRYDHEGRLLKSVLRGLPAHLNSEGRMYLMSRPDLSPYFPGYGLGSKARRHFTAKSSVAIHEIWKTGRWHVSLSLKIKLAIFLVFVLLSFYKEKANTYHLEQPLNYKYSLDDNSKIAVIGGGPSGALFSIFAMKMAKMVGKKIQVTLFEPKDFTRDGPVGCNRCGGVISEHLVQTLAVEGINIPPNVVQRGINSYVLHTQKGDVCIESPATEKRIATVYRGGGPKGIQEKDRDSFDGFLLQRAVQEGAFHVPLKVDGIKKGEKPVLTSDGKDVIEADLVVGAFGVNSSTHKLFEGLHIGYKQPKTAQAFITEIELGNERVSEYFGSAIHFFLLPVPKNIKFAALIPKGRYVTLCILGSGIDQKTVTALLDNPAVKKVLPAEILNDKFCKCFPKLSLGSAKVAFADRIVVIGDAGSTRLFKDGIGASYLMGKAAAKTAIFHGVSKSHFAEHYLPVYKRTIIDNRYGRFIYLTTNTYKNISVLTEGMVNVVRKEQKNPEKFPRLSSILWDTFTGNETYKSIFMRGTNIGMHVRLGVEFVRAMTRWIL